MKVIIAAAGTAGHINPGLAIANKIKNEEKNSEIMFIGTTRGLENDLVPRAGYKLKTIDVEDDSSEELKAVINQNQNIEELISALQVLGYTKKEVEKIIPKLDNKDDNLENLIKKALLLLSK